jgi:hypothetical protein
MLVFIRIWETIRTEETLDRIEEAEKEYSSFQVVLFRVVTPCSYGVTASRLRRPRSESSHQKHQNRNHNIKSSLIRIGLSGKEPHLEDVLGSGGIAARIFNLGLRRSLVSFTSQPIYFRGISPQYTLDGNLGGFWSRSVRDSKEMKFQALPRFEPQSSNP